MNEAITRCRVCGWPVLQNWVYKRETCDSCSEWADHEIEREKLTAWNEGLYDRKPTKASDVSYQPPEVAQDLLKRIPALDHDDYHSADERKEQPDTFHNGLQRPK